MEQYSNSGLTMDRWYVHGFVSGIPACLFDSLIYRGYSKFLLNMAFISSSEVENIYIS